MKVSEILMDYQEYGAYGGWVSDKNEIFGTDTEQEHLEIINNHGLASYERAFEAGWVRIIWNPKGWSLEGMPKAIKRTFRKIAKRFFTSAENSTVNFSLHVDLLSTSLDRHSGVTHEYFIMPEEKTRLLQFMNGL